MLNDRPLEPGAAGRLAILTGEVCGIRGAVRVERRDPMASPATWVEAARPAASSFNPARSACSPIEQTAVEQARQAEQQAHIVDVLANLLDGVQAVYALLTIPHEPPASDAPTNSDVPGAKTPQVSRQPIRKKRQLNLRFRPPIAP